MTFQIGDAVRIVRTEAICIPNEYLGAIGRIIRIEDYGYYMRVDRDGAEWSVADIDIKALSSERILCVAIKFGDLICSIPAPARHHDVFGAIASINVHPIPTRGQVQGFLTTSGRFVNRREARKIAEAAEQLRAYETDKDGVPYIRQHCDLFSEDVW